VSGRALIGIAAGEASGDLLGAELVRAIRTRLPEAQFVGIGGPKMQAEGVESWFPMERLAVRGYVEVLKHYPGLLSLRRSLKGRMSRAHPRVFIGIDAPDFNLPLEAKLKRNAIPTVHFVSPSLWAWRGGRIRFISRAVNRVLLLFPFEVPIYRHAGIPFTYVGHPLADLIPLEDVTNAAREQLRLSQSRRIVTLLPGSRQSELHAMAELFIRTARLLVQQFSDLGFLVPLVSRETREIFEAALYREQAADLPLTVLFGHAREAIAASDAVLAASGTATLEAALYKKPMVITYRMAGLTWKLMSRMRYQPWVGLPNIIAGEYIVPELLQDDATPENLAQAMLNVISDPVVRERLPQRLRSIHLSLRQNAADKAAKAVMPWLA